MDIGDYVIFDDGTAYGTIEEIMGDEILIAQKEINLVVICGEITVSGNPRTVRHRVRNHKYDILKGRMKIYPKCNMVMWHV